MPNQKGKDRVFSHKKVACTNEKIFAKFGVDPFPDCNVRTLLLRTIGLGSVLRVSPDFDGIEGVQSALQKVMFYLHLDRVWIHVIVFVVTTCLIDIFSVVNT